MDIKRKPLLYKSSNTITEAEEVAIAAARWLKMGIPVELRRNGLPTVDPRTAAERKDPVATYFALREMSGLGLAIVTGPKTGILAVTAYTYDERSGLNALKKAGFYCICGNNAIRHEALVDGKREGVFHTVLFYAGKDTFCETAMDDLEGVVISKSGESTIIPPGSCDFGLGLGVVTRSTFEGPDKLTPIGVPYLPDGLRQMIRAAERRTLAEKRKPKVHGGVLPELYAPVPEGERNNALARRAGYLLGVRKLTEEKALEVLQDINQRCCQPPLDPCEVGKIARSIAKKHGRHG